ncbi:MAG: sulfite exporter TauE/SafE family protein [Clostridiales bacterium]|nr:sulfite exporter TauE/SafE family protein [Clostridiales bacterium]
MLYAPIIVRVIVCIFAGLGAGLGTGFAGMSAAAVIVPMLTVFLGTDVYPLGIDHFTAVGIALASDVLASAVSTVTYAKHKNIDVKHSWVLFVTVIAATVGGTFVASFATQTITGNKIMEAVSMLVMLSLGLRFLFFPPKPNNEKLLSLSPTSRVVRSIVCGLIIGFICGFVGAGGGIMMLLLLTSVLGFDVKTAVGTSVFIMTFTALTGSVAHFAIDFTGLVDHWGVLVGCVLATLAFAQIAALVANRVKTKILNIVVGTLLTVLSLVLICFNYL